MIARPSKVVCVGMNYRDHAAEAGMAVPDRPILFAKWPSSIVGDGEAIVIPPGIERVDYEAELGVVIARRVRDLTAADALDAVAGYVCVNDVSARGEQFTDGQWTRAKSFDTFTPVGPAVVPADEVGDPQALRIRCLVDGEPLQDSSTSEMVFGVAEIIAHASRGTTLEPGDLIATGTPAGVGFTRDPPVYLTDGMTVTIEIERVGSLTNHVRGVS